ncbi:hypothetical protein ABB37_08422 [Leptomonas pyrrhocoris]|uniref:C-CAP/cofactor C-like domain-containing protein n=1 Tax=Leptomonas pyrrhocoris TaxID=157538 RepID=A0A0M9FT38_LEPPY|nr:hypothetical protein ABB37_08422 [Leptomonas pyrrhocoris]XP_015653970.1 hypothetical protein ABB37_08422 [Leptomonas pyrrhocoris]KPA75530.1 hypothetical protein ABB37_08422 [Leptomonas pyrrhocoris]KPA75531.1 hypothetical protein ABB37_08422 [Leptomonas pyrrhocoris]|eukprot:XP_015653969.1 hypothetical protein ABB37_08422 [Leptomonas pyrrhocoris]
MGACSEKAGGDVAERRVDGRVDASSQQEPPPPTPPLPPQQLEDATETSERKTRRWKHRRVHGGGTAAQAEETTTCAASPPPPPQQQQQSCHDGSNATPDTPRGRLLENQKLSLHHTVTSNKKAEEEEAPQNNPIMSSEAQGPAYDSVLARLKQGSSYLWLRSTYAIPYLKPTPLLTVDKMRELRNSNTAFQQLWGVLGEAACIIGPYAAAPAPAGPSSPPDGGKDVGDDLRVVPPLVKDDDARIAKKSKAHATANDPVITATAASSNVYGKPQATAAAAAAAGASSPQQQPAGQRDASEIRVMGARHINIEGDEARRHPIICRGDVYRGKHMWIHKLRSRCCCVFEYLSGVDLSDCCDAMIVLAPTAGAVSLSNCHRCLVIAAAAQVRVLSCSSVVLSINVAGFPVIEKSSSIGVAPLLGWYAYSKLPIDFRLANLSLFTNNYSTVRDVTPPPPLSASSAASVSLSGSKHVDPAAASAGTSNASLPASNFVYVDLWELEAAVWKAMAEQRWGQLISEANAAASAATVAAQGPSRQLKDNALHPPGSTAALVGGPPPLPDANGGVQHGPRQDDEEDDAKHGDDDGEAMMTSDEAFLSMISYGHISPSTVSKTSIKGSTTTATATTSASAEDVSRSDHRAVVPHAVPASAFASSQADNAVAQLPRWRQSGFNGNVATDGSPLDPQNVKSNYSTGSALQAAALKRRGTTCDAANLAQLVLRAVPLLPLSTLRDAPSLLLLLSHGVDVSAPANGGAEEEEEEEKSAFGGNGSKRTARYNPLELALAIYTQSCAVPATLGAQLIPADFFEQAWKLKLIILTAKGGGYDLARRITRDIEGSRRRCFLETVRAMLHAPPPPASQVDGVTTATTAGKDARSGGGGEDVALSLEDEDAFSEALSRYLRTTSLVQRCGAVLLLNTVELRCTETAVREFVAPVFYKLCEPVGLRSAAEAASTSASNGSGHRLHLPWKSGNSTNAHSAASSSASAEPPRPQTTASAAQLEHNVDMRRLFGSAIQRMTGQTCVAMLALLAPKSIPQSFQRPPGTGGRSIDGALTPAELDAWAKRAAEAQHIFTPQRSLEEDEAPHGLDERGGATAAAEAESHDEPTAAESPTHDDVHGSDGAGRRSKKAGPTFATPAETEATPRSLEERVWPQTVLVNVTVPLRFVSLLQGTLFFRSQMHAAATAGAQQMREQEPEKA